MFHLKDEAGKNTSTGVAQASKVFEELEKWDLVDIVRAMSYDTTASNTGIKNGSCVLLERLLGKELFYLACRKHFHELIGKAVWYKLFANDNGPDNAMFKRLKDKWYEIDTSPDSDSMTLELEEDEKNDLVEFYTNILNKESPDHELLVRGDYQQVAEASLALLGVPLPDGTKAKWVRPSGVHKARFMAFSLGAMKCFAFAKSLGYDEDTVEALRRIADFMVRIYNQHFLVSSRGVDAAINDLDLFKKLTKYKEEDTDVGEAAITVLQRHFWYLTPTLAMFGLFSDKLANNDKASIAGKLLSLVPPVEDKLGKPKFPTISCATQLIDLITEDSYRFFKILGLKYDWLKMEPQFWDIDPDYGRARQFVTTAKVCNDCCERAIKLGSEYAQILTKDNVMRNKILQVVEAERKMYPGSKKSTMNK